MATVASLPDVVARLGRPVLPEEEDLLKARLRDAEAAIARRIPDLATQALADVRFKDNLIGVTCDVALRACGLVSRIDGVVPAPGTVQEMSDGRPGFVSIRNEEWRRLGIHMMDVWNPYPDPFEDVSVWDADMFGYNAGWSSWPNCE